MTQENLLRVSQRPYSQLTLMPLNWVSHEWRRFVTIVADLARLPKRQVIAMTDPETDLVGYYGAVAYDFYHSRFR
jgi:hypothetical protein